MFLVWGSAAEGVAFFPQSLLDGRKINLSFHNNFVCSVVKMEPLLLKVSVPLLFPQDICCLRGERDQRHHHQHVKPSLLLLYSSIWAIVKLFWAKTRQLHQEPLLAWRSSSKTLFCLGREQSCIPSCNVFLKACLQQISLFDWLWQIYARFYFQHAAPYTSPQKCVVNLTLILTLKDIANWMSKAAEAMKN